MRNARSGSVGNVDEFGSAGGSGDQPYFPLRQVEGFREAGQRGRGCHSLRCPLVHPHDKSTAVTSADVGTAGSGVNTNRDSHTVSMPAADACIFRPGRLTMAAWTTMGYC